MYVKFCVRIYAKLHAYVSLRTLAAYLIIICMDVSTALSKDFKLFLADSSGMIYALDENGVTVETISEDEQIFDVAVDAFELQRSGLSIVYSTVKNGTGRIIRHNIANNYSEVIVDVQVQGINFVFYLYYTLLHRNLRRTLLTAMF